MSNTFSFEGASDFWSMKTPRNGPEFHREWMVQGRGRGPDDLAHRVGPRMESAEWVIQGQSERAFKRWFTMGIITFRREPTSMLSVALPF